MSEQNMKLSPEIISGISYKKYRNNLYSIALGTPSRYYKIREKVLESLETDLIKLIYTIWFNALTESKDASGNPIAVSSAEFRLSGITPDGALVLPPAHYMTHKINELALAAVSDMEIHLQKLCDLLVPQDFNSIASSNLKLTGKASAIDG